MGFRCLLAGLCASAALAASAEATPTTITEYPVEVGHPADVESPLVQPDGTVWFTDHWWPEGSYHAVIGRMKPEGKVEEFDEGLAASASPNELLNGPDGNVWFPDDGSGPSWAAIGRIKPSGAITEFTAGLNGAEPRTLTIGPDGNLWFTGLGDTPAIGFATPTGAITSYDLPGRPWDAVGGPDGNVWFTYGGESTEPAIGRVERRQDGTTLITLFHSGLHADSLPLDIVASQNGYLWFTDHSATTPAIGRVSTSNGEIEEFSAGLRPEVDLWDLAAGLEGNVWFADSEGAVGRVTPAGEITEFGDRVLFPQYGPRHIIAGADGNMWFTYGVGAEPAVGKVSPLGEITLYRNGLSPSANPGEIAEGPGGEMWFISNTVERQALGRLIPGDDTPPPPPQPGAPELGPQPFGRLVLKEGDLRVRHGGKVLVRISCQSPAACSGTLKLMAYRRRWMASRVLGVAPFLLPSGASTTIVLKLNGKGARLMRQGRHQWAQLTVTPDSAFMVTPVRILLTRPESRR